MASEIISTLTRDLYILEDENNPAGSKINTIYPTTIIDQIFDNTSPSNKTLRTILAELKQDIINAGRGDIIFPVTSVNGYTEDVVLTRADFGLDNIDNTRDNEKPLSDPQRAAVSEMLRNYHFEVDFSDLYRHVQDSTNPHKVTIEQLNETGSVTNMINAVVSRHNTSASDSTHRDIRDAISRVRESVSNIAADVQNRIDTAMAVLDSHYRDPNAHMELFDTKENSSNKSMMIVSDEADHVKYPTARAVVEFVANRLVDFKKDLPDVKQWIDDIYVIDRREDLPEPNARAFRKAYFIRYGLSNQDEIAICRMNPDHLTYDWDISSFGTYSKFNQNHFLETDEGLSVNLNRIAEILMNEGEIADDMRATLKDVIPDILRDYYTRQQIDDMRLVGNIQILPGTQDGTIRYFINDDEQTMSEDVHVAGLQRLAYLEWVTEHEIADQSVHSRHILNRAIENRHMGDKAVAANNMKASYRTIFGNIDDSTGTTVKEISLDRLASLLDPMFSVTLDNVDMVSMQTDTIARKVRNAYHAAIGWRIPESMVNFRLNDNKELTADYDFDQAPPDITVNSDGELILESQGDDMGLDLEKYSFRVTPDGLLWMTYSS